jgi:hypothetical protein
MKGCAPACAGLVVEPKASGEASTELFKLDGAEVLANEAAARSIQQVGAVEVDF